MGRHQYDYAALEVEYIQGGDEITHRLIAERVGASNSTISDYAKKHEWERKRADYRATVERRMLDGLVTTYLQDVAAVESEFVTAFRHAIRRFLKDLESGAITVTVRDLGLMVDKFNLLRGEATSRTESKNLDLHATAPGLTALLDGAPDQLLRQLADLAGRNGAGSQPVGRGPLVVLEGTSEEAVS